MSTIDNLKQQLDSLGIKYRSNATESNLKHLLSKHRAQQPKEDKVAQNEVQSDLDSPIQDDLVKELTSEELGQGTKDSLSDEEVCLQVEKLQLSSTYGEFGNEEVCNPEDVMVTFSTTNEDGEPVTIEGFSEDSIVMRKEAMLELESDVRESVIINQAIENFNPNLHTDKPTFGYKNTDFESDIILIKTNVLKGFIDQLTEAGMKGYDFLSGSSSVNVLDTPYRVKLVKGKPVVVEFMQPEVKIKVKVYKQSDFIKELLRIIKLGGTIGSVRNITMLSGLYVFEALVDSNYELRKNIDFYAGKV